MSMHFPTRDKASFDILEAIRLYFIHNWHCGREGVEIVVRLYEAFGK